MADFLVHFASAHALGKPLKEDRLRAILFVGVCFPDLLYKGVLYLFNASTWVCEISHTPLGLIPICYAAALLFEESWRKRAFIALLGGSYLHILVDVTKSYMGSGVILWAFPFSMDRVELGWYYPEDTLLLMLPSLILILVVEGVTRLKNRNTTKTQRH